MDTDSDDPNEYLKYNPLFNYQKVFKNKYNEAYCKDKNIRRFCQTIHQKLPADKVFKIKIIRSSIYDRLKRQKGLHYDFRIISTKITSVGILLKPNVLHKNPYRDFDIYYLHSLFYHQNIYPSHIGKAIRVKLSPHKLNRLHKEYNMIYHDFIRSYAMTFTVTRL